MSVFISAIVVAASYQGQLKMEPQRCDEIIEQRELNAKAFRMSDGSIQYVIYANNVHYKDKNGKLQEIDNSIVLDYKIIDNTVYSYRNAANTITIRFGDIKEGAFPILLESNGKAVSFAILGGTSSEVRKLNNELEQTVLANRVEPENTVIYRDIFENVDIAYTVLANGIKENIILKKPTEKNEYNFVMNLKGVKAEQQKDDLIVFKDDHGNEVFRISDLYAIDANEVITTDITCKLIDTGDTIQIKVTVDKDYLLDKKRAWPVVIDPSLMVTGAQDTFDSFVSSKYPDTNYNQPSSGNNIYFLRTGRDDAYYIRRSYIRFYLPAKIPSENITSAYLRLKKYSGATPNINAYRVLSTCDPAAITWNNKPGYTTVYGSSTAVHDGNDWWKMDVTTLVKNWVSGTYINYGFLIKDVNESDPNQWTTFYSSDAASPNKPELIINYTKEAEIRTKDARIYYDASCTESASTLTTYFNSATQEIKSTFNIEFKLAYVTFSSLLDGSSCSKTICDSSCGALSSCSTLHHKGAGRLIDLLKSSSYYTYRLVGHRLCYYNSSHGEIIGLGYRPGRDSITSLVSSPNIPRSIQHELTHNLGASHTTCVEYQDCVLKGDMNKWCEKCKTDIATTN